MTRDGIRILVPSLSDNGPIPNADADEEYCKVESDFDYSEHCPLLLSWYEDSNDGGV